MITNVVKVDHRARYVDRQRYDPVIIEAAKATGMSVTTADGWDLLEFLQSWDGPGVTEERLVRYAVDWLTNPT
jgi:hypothetical protein